MKPRGTAHWTVAITLVAAIGVSARPTDQVQAAPRRDVALRLAPSERTRTWRFDVELGTTRHFRLVMGALTSPAEVRVTLTGPRCPLTFDVSGRVLLNPNDTLPVAYRGRDFRMGTMATTSLDLRLDDVTAVLPTVIGYGGCGLEVIVTRLSGPCWMAATVSGDVNGTFIGDGAYFNIFPQGAPITTGTMFDPGAVALVGGQAYLDGLAAMGTDEDTSDRPGFGDRFGLTLADVRYDDEPATPTTGRGMANNLAEALGGLLGRGSGRSAGAGAASAMEGMGGFLAAMETLLGRFTLEASAPDIVPYLNDLANEGVSNVAVPLSLVRVTAGAADADLSAVKFSWAQGQPGSGELRILQANLDVVAGRVRGTLLTDDLYDGRRLEIELVAHFAAQRGFRSCIR